MTSQKQWLEVVLKKKSYEESPLEVIAVEDAGGVVGKGENYFSKIERVKATVLLGNGKTKKISLIIKNQHETERMKKFTLELGVFFREIVMYRDILPKMEDLLNEINDSEDIFWGRCFDYRLYDRIVFEDLNVLGYRMADRKKQLGLESALLVVRNLAKFHALSMVLLERGEIPLDIFGKHIWTRNPELTTQMITANAERLLNAMKTWGDDWNEAVDRFQKAIPDLGKRFVEELDAKPGEFYVLCHGDCSTNNVLFKGEDLEKPTSVKLLDLQACAVATPARDLHHFLTTSVRLDVRKQHLDQILQEYVHTLKYHAATLHYESPLPDVDSVKDNLRKKAIFCLEHCLYLVTIVTGETQDMRDIEEISKAFEDLQKGGAPDNDILDLYQFNTTTTTNIIKDAVNYAIECGTI